MNGQLADVVEKRGPTQAIAIVVGQSQLLRHQVRVGAHPLGMAPGLAVVRTEGGSQRHDLLGCHDGLVGDPLGARFVDAPAQVTGRPRAQGHRQPARCPPGEDHSHPQQHGQGERSSGEPFGPDEHDGRRTEDRDPAQRRAAHRRRRRPQVPDERRRTDGERHGNREHRHGDRGGGERTRPPTGGVRLVLSHGPTVDRRGGKGTKIAPPHGIDTLLSGLEQPGGEDGEMRPEGWTPDSGATAGASGAPTPGRRYPSGRCGAQGRLTSSPCRAWWPGGTRCTSSS